MLKYLVHPPASTDATCWNFASEIEEWPKTATPNTSVNLRVKSLKENAWDQMDTWESCSQGKQKMESYDKDIDNFLPTDTQYKKWTATIVN